MSDQVDGRIQPAKAVRMIFSNLLEAKAFKNQKPEDAKFGGTFVIPADLIDPLKDKAIAVAKASFPLRELKTLHFPFTKAETEAANAVAKGKDPSIYPIGTIILRAKSKYQPVLSWLDRTVNPSVVRTLGVTPQDILLRKQKFYSGCIVVPQLNFVPYEGFGGGITAYLDAVLFYKDSQRIGGLDAAEAFKGHVGQTTDEDPTAGASALDDEIPF